MSTGETVAKRFRYLATVQKGRLPINGNSDAVDADMVPYLTMEYLRNEIADPPLISNDPRAVVANDGDLLLLWDGSNAGEFLRAKSGIVSSTAALVTSRGVDREYLYWACKALEDRVRSETVGMGIPHVNGEYLANLRVPTPHEQRQRAIADYLDRETARIDALIAAKERVLALLAEKRRALITRAVTKGLDPTVPMKDSGIPWLGKIPAHWEIVALRFVVDITSGATPDTGRAEYWDGEIPWVSPKDMKRDEIADAEDHVSDLALSQRSLRLIEPGAVLIVVRGMILAHSFPTAVTTAPVTINQDMKALRCRESLDPYYLRDFFRGHEEHVVSLADSSAHGTRKLETEILGRFEIALPPAAEQRAITGYIGHSTSRLDALRAATERTIALLKERRSALIAAAVTGQIDVGSAA